MKISELIHQQAKFLLVGCDSKKERDGMSELYHVLVKFLKEQPIEIFELSIRGLFLVAIKAAQEPQSNPQRAILFLVFISSL